jgi:hypothetical protein
VDRAQRRDDAEELVPRPDLGRDRVRQVGEDVEEHPRRRQDDAVLHALAEGVDRVGRRRELLTLLLGVDEEEVRVRQLALPSEVPDVAAEDGTLALDEDVHQLLGVEERDVVPRGAVVDRHPVDLRPRARLEERGLDDLAHERHVLADRQVGQRGELAEMQVAAREVPEQVADRDEVELGEVGVRLRVDVALERLVEPGVRAGRAHSTPTSRG